MTVCTYFFLSVRLLLCKNACLTKLFFMVFGQLPYRFHPNPQNGHFFRFVRQEGISTRGSVHRSVGLCVRYASLKLARFGRGDVTHQTEHSWRCFEVVVSVCPSIYLSFHISDMSSAKVSTRRDIDRTHRCPVGLVSFLSPKTKISCQTPL